MQAFKKPRIVVFGESYSQNLGDGLIYECVRDAFQDIGVDTIPVDLSGKTGWVTNSETQRPITASIFRRIARAMLRNSRVLRRGYTAFVWYVFKRHQIVSRWDDLIASSDAVVIGGGQLFTDVNFGFPPRIHEVFRIARRHNKPLAIFGIGAGSGWGYLAKKMYSKALGYASYVSARDEASARILATYVSKSIEVHIHADPAFYLSKFAASLPTNGNWLGINIHPAVHFRTFVPEFKNITDVEFREFWINLIIQAQSRGQYDGIRLITNGDIADYNEATLIEAEVARRGAVVKLDARPERTVDLIQQIDQVTTLVCTRMHAGITAYCRSRVVCPISWDPKVDGVWKTIGFHQPLQPMELFMSPDPWAKIEQFISLKKINFSSDMVSGIDLAARSCVRALNLKTC